MAYLIILLWVALFYWAARISADLARRKGRSVALWSILALLFFPLSHLVLIFVPASRRNSKLASAA